MAKNFKKGAADKDDDEYFSVLDDGGMDASRKVRGVVRMQRSWPRVFFVFAVCARHRTRLNGVPEFTPGLHLVYT